MSNDTYLKVFQNNLIETPVMPSSKDVMKSKVEFAEGVTRNGNIAIRIPKNSTSISLAKDNPIIINSLYARNGGII